MWKAGSLACGSLTIDLPDAARHGRAAVPRPVAGRLGLRRCRLQADSANGSARPGNRSGRPPTRGRVPGCGYPRGRSRVPSRHIGCARQEMRTLMPETAPAQGARRQRRPPWSGPAGFHRLQGWVLRVSARRETSPRPAASAVCRARWAVCGEGYYPRRHPGPIQAEIRAADARARHARRSRDGPIAVWAADWGSRRRWIRRARTLGWLGRCAVKAVRARPAGTRPMRRHPAAGRSLPGGGAVPGHGLPAGAGVQLEAAPARRLSIRLPNTGRPGCTRCERTHGQGSVHAARQRFARAAREQG